ncbi:MAG: hypothetical protein NTW05_03640 [Pseudonocardiales bacterium]|nr:hypothetical protein [Pseudonocardiales bacterium]
MSLAEIAAAGAGVCLLLAVLLAVTARRTSTGTTHPAAEVGRVAAPSPPWVTALRRAWWSVGDPAASATARRRRVLIAVGVGVAAWAVTGWPAAALAVVAAGLWLPWLLGSAREVQARIEKLEALEGWCRRMADVLAGGGAVGLTQAIAMTGAPGMYDSGAGGRGGAARAEEPIAEAVAVLVRRLQDGGNSLDGGGDDRRAALREFADAIDDRAGDTVAAALLLALGQQSGGIAPVLRQLADGVARDVRARRDIEAARAEDRQSIRLLLVIQAGLLVGLAAVPTFAAPYGTAAGQAVMAMLLSGTTALLVWMRRLALGRPAPRFFGAHLAGAGGRS